ncbi:MULTISPECIES: hypothetical protein [Herbaspirillum]|jgi:hypothetical protein|uniref:hypothetical protein n=1 Tax=Herbaspirillum TaxID=963 RepID=UPI002E75D36E|nr:hypothetical protein [Herbaspirillum huttiense]|tara:strand:- start:1093 stop:1377 length:285 start_codon:yes stop_codon:yes gene_type:complete
MFGALFSACLANLCAEFAYLLGELAAARHQSSRSSTNVGTVGIGGNAPGHHLDILFLQTGGGTLVASCRTRVTGLDTGAKFFTGHFDLLGKWAG